MKAADKRQLKKRTRFFLLILASLIALALLWGFAVEPKLLTVSEISFTDTRLPAALEGIRAVYISDVHVGPYYSEADVERLVKRIGELDPDIVFFGGDLVQRAGDVEAVDRERVARAFAALEPRLGKFAVLGNHDIRTPVMQAIAEAMLRGGGFTLLYNSAAEAAPGFFVAGTAPWPDEGEDSPRNQADVTQVAWTTDGGAFSLLLSHEPEQAHKNAQYPFALQLSGHTHGGQVNFPFAGFVYKKAGMGDYLSGFYDAGDLRMYVSRGVGTSVVRVRFFAPPEIVVLTLHGK